MASEMTILMLNDDCLLSIFDYLNAREIFAMETACPRFVAIAQMTYRRLKILDFDKIAQSGVLSLIETNDICRRVGPYIHTLRASRESFKISGQCVPRSILRYCKNLHTIFLNGFSFPNQATIDKLTQMCKAVKVLDLKYCFNIKDNIEPALKASNQLERLNLSGNDKITGQCIRHLTNIKELNVAQCIKIKPDFFIQFCEANQQLQNLNISKRGIDNPMMINLQCLQTISGTLKHLECLTINDQYNKLPEEAYIAVADLPKIKHLYAVYNSKSKGEHMMDIFLARFSTHNRLEYLELYMDLSETSCMHTLRLFTKLKIFKDHSLSSDWIFNEKVLTCTDTLEELHIRRLHNNQFDNLWKFITKFKQLRHLNILSVNLSNMFRITIDDEFNLDNRPHILEIVVTYDFLFATEWEDPKNIYKKNLIKGKLEGKAKLIYNGKILV